MTVLLLGIVLMTASVGCLFVALFGRTARVPAARRLPEGEAPQSALETVGDGLVAAVERMMKRGRWSLFTHEELDLAGINRTPAYAVTLVSLVAVAVLAVLAVLAGPILGLLAVLMVPLVAKLVVRQRRDKRRKAFAQQLDAALQTIASALRAGHSLPRALDAVGRDSISPTREEFARIVNENRLGRDLVDALESTADRMGNEDFRWISDAVAVHRETGGNLNEVLDRVSTTLRERRELRDKIHALSAEGRISGVVLLALPVVVAGIYSLLNPTYLAPMFTEAIGRVLLGAAAIMMVVGWLWMRAITNVKV